MVHYVILNVTRTTNNSNNKNKHQDTFVMILSMKHFETHEIFHVDKSVEPINETWVKNVKTDRKIILYY